MSEHEPEVEAMPPEDAQEAPGAIGEKMWPDVPSDEPEAQDGDASPVPEGDSVEEAGETAPESLPEAGDAPAGTDPDEPAAPGGAGDPVGGHRPGSPDAAVEVAELDDPEPSEMELAFSEVLRANEKVRKAREYLEKRQGITKSAKEEEKEAENRLELAQKELEETIDESERFPLIHYGKSKPTKAKPKPAKVVDVKPEKAKPQDAPAAEPWRAVKLDTLGLPKGIMAKLEEASLFTVGDITDLTSQPYKSLQDIPGIGATAEAKIADALIKFWADNPQFTRGEPDKPEDIPTDNPAAEIAEPIQGDPVEEAPATIPFPADEASSEPAQEHGSEADPVEAIPDEPAPADPEPEKPKKKGKKKSG